MDGAHQAPAPAIRVAGLRKVYGQFEAVKGIDFEVRARECFGLLGPNGAGKTTTIKIVTGRAVATGGRAEVLGLDVSTAPAAVRARIGIVPQENNLDPDLTLLENLEVYARYFGLDKATAAARAAELLTFMQLDHKAKARPHELSGGMKRRAVLARALLNRPELVVLDEPTTGLDPQARVLVWEKLQELKAAGVTLLLTTHYMDEAWRLCDRIFIVDDGRVIAEGHPHELVRRHVSRWVLELPDADEGLIARLPDHVRNLVKQTERVGRALHIYNEENEAVLGALRAAAVPLGEYLARPANLEDLFLLLTGRDLRE